MNQPQGAEVAVPPDFRELVDLAQSDVPESALPRLRELLATTPEHSEAAVKLRLVELMALIFSRRLDEAVIAATAAAELAGRVGFPGWQADAIAQRALAHWETKDRVTAYADLILCETMIDAALAGPEWNGARTAVANVYVECGFYELAVQHFAVAAAADRGPLTGVPGNVTDAMNLGWLYLRWTFDDERAGEIGVDSPPYGARMDQARHWYEIADQRSGGSAHRWHLEIQAGLAISMACLDPGAHVDRLAALCQLDLGPDAENDRVLETVRYSYLLRRLGRVQDSMRVADRLLAAVDGPSIWQSTVREVYDEVHQAQLAAGVPGAVAADGYLRALRRELWQRRAWSLTAYRIRRDVAVLAARQAESDLLVSQDPLTGLGNRRALTDWGSAHPVGPATVAMIDLDGFKDINDRFGHPVGDQILMQVATALRTSCGPAARIIRYGGDEFVVLLDSTPEPAALDASLADGLATIDIATWAPGVRLAATVGIAQTGPGGPTGLLLDAADADLIRKKG